MSIEYIYQVFLINRSHPNHLSISIANDEDIYYQIIFLDESECSNYIRVIHNLAKEMTINEVETSKQKLLIKEFILENPFDYDYEIHKFEVN